jgi:hypothetical protein
MPALRGRAGSAADALEAIRQIFPQAMIQLAAGQTMRGLIQDLAPMRQDQHALATRYSILGNLVGNDGLAAAGRQHEQDISTGDHFALDVLDGLDLIVAKVGHAGALALAKAAASVACTMSSPTAEWSGLVEAAL